LGLWTCVVLAGLLVAVTPTAAHAKYWYLGVGQEHWQSGPDDLWKALHVWPEWSGLGAFSSGDPDGEMQIVKNQYASQIASWIQDFKGKVQPGDLFLFYYSGEIGYHGDQLPMDEPTPYWEEALYYQWTYLWDDQLGDLFCCIPECVSTVAIFDADWSGGMIDGSYDLSRQQCQDKESLFVMASRPNHRTWYGPREDYPLDFSEALLAGLQPGGPSGMAMADVDGDGLSADEWFNYADAAQPLAVSWSSMDEAHLGKKLATPEPATCVLLLTSVPLALAYARRRMKA
jgi:hypothetical protein